MRHDPSMTLNSGYSTERTQVSKADTALSVLEPMRKRSTQEKGERPPPSEEALREPHRQIHHVKCLKDVLEAPEGVAK